MARQEQSLAARQARNTAVDQPQTSSQRLQKIGANAAWQSRTPNPARVTVGSTDKEHFFRKAKNTEASPLGDQSLSYTTQMIKHFRHRGLQAFFEHGSKAGIQPHHAARLARQLKHLDRSRQPEDMNVPGWKLHALSGKLADHWSVWISGNWRLTFMFEDEDAVLVDYQDYH